MTPKLCGRPLAQGLEEQKAKIETREPAGKSSEQSWLGRRGRRKVLRLSDYLFRLVKSSRSASQASSAA